MKYLLLLTLCVITRFVLSNDDFEIIDEGDDASAGAGSGTAGGSKRKKTAFEKAYNEYLGEQEEFKWTDQMLADNQIH